MRSHEIPQAIIKKLERELIAARKIHDTYFTATHSSIKNEFLDAKIKASNEVFEKLWDLLGKLRRNEAQEADCDDFVKFINNDLAKYKLGSDSRAFLAKYDAAKTQVRNAQHAIEKINAKKQAQTKQEESRKKNLEKLKGSSYSPDFKLLGNPRLSTKELTDEAHALYKLWQHDKIKFQEQLLLLGPEKQEIKDRILYDAVSISDVDTVRQSIHLGANITHVPDENPGFVVEDMLGQTLFYGQPLTRAQIDIIDILISAGARVDQVIRQAGTADMTLLKKAVALHCVNLAERLIEARATLTEADLRVRAPLKEMMEAGYHLQNAFRLLIDYDRIAETATDMQTQNIQQQVYSQLNMSFKISPNIITERIMMIARETIPNVLGDGAYKLLLSGLLTYGLPLPAHLFLVIGESLLTANNPFGRLFLLKAEQLSAITEEERYIGDIMTINNTLLLSDLNPHDVRAGKISPQVRRDIELYDLVLKEIFHDTSGFYDMNIEDIAPKLTKKFKCDQTSLCYALGRALEDIAATQGTDMKDRNRQLRMAGYFYRQAAGYRDADWKFWDCLGGERNHFLDSMAKGDHPSPILAKSGSQGIWMKATPARKKPE